MRGSPMPEPVILKVGGTYLVPVKVVADSFHIHRTTAMDMCEEIGLKVRTLRGLPYVSLGELERALIRWFGGDPSLMGENADYYRSIAETSVRTRLKRLANTRSIGKRKKTPKKSQRRPPKN